MIEGECSTTFGANNSNNNDVVYSNLVRKSAQ